MKKMNQYRNTDKDIHIRIYRYVVGCMQDIVVKIPKRPETIPIIGQLSDALTSVGANDQEADAANSRKDFLAKYAIVRKELKETQYWLSVVRDCSFLDAAIVDPYIEESEEIRKIVSKIMANSQR